jgi:hypothetical protein
MRIFKPKTGLSAPIFLLRKKYFRCYPIALFKNGLRAVFEHGVLHTQNSTLGNQAASMPPIHADFRHGVLHTQNSTLGNQPPSMAAHPCGFSASLQNIGYAPDLEPRPHRHAERFH